VKNVRDLSFEQVTEMPIEERILYQIEEENPIRPLGLEGEKARKYAEKKIDDYCNDSCYYTDAGGFIDAKRAGEYVKRQTGDLIREVASINVNRSISTEERGLTYLEIIRGMRSPSYSYIEMKKAIKGYHELIPKEVRSTNLFNEVYRELCYKMTEYAEAESKYSMSDMEKWRELVELGVRSIGEIIVDLELVDEFTDIYEKIKNPSIEEGDKETSHFDENLDFELSDEEKNLTVAISDDEFEKKSQCLVKIEKE